MQVNHDYDLSKPLQSAIRGKAPYVGIPMPGHAPLMFERDRLARALKGVQPVNIEVIVHETGGRSLLVEGYDGRVRTRMVMHSKPAGWWRTWQGQRVLDAWHKAEARKRCRIVTIPSGADRKTAAQLKKAAEVLRKLTKERDGMGYPVTLRNPAVPGCSRYTDEGHSREYAEQAWKSTRECKRLRTIVGAIAHQARRENWTTQRLYKELDNHRIEHTKLSAMTGKQREMQGAATVFDYNRNLYKFCRGTGTITGRGYSLYGHDCGRPDSWAVRELERRLSDGQEWGPARYMVKLADLQERRALQSHIDSIKSLMARLRGETEGTGETQDQAAEVAA